MAARVCAHGAHALAASLGANRLGADHVAAAGTAERSAQGVIQPHPWRRGRQRRDLEYRTLKTLLEVGPRSVRIAQAKDRGEGDALFAAQERPELGGERGPKLRLVEAPSEADRVRLGSTDLDVKLDRSRVEAGQFQVGRAQ